MSKRLADADSAAPRRGFRAGLNVGQVLIQDRQRHGIGNLAVFLVLVDGAKTSSPTANSTDRPFRAGATIRIRLLLNNLRK